MPQIRVKVFASFAQAYTLTRAFACPLIIQVQEKNPTCNQAYLHAHPATQPATHPHTDTHTHTQTHSCLPESCSPLFRHLILPCCCSLCLLLIAPIRLSPSFHSQRIQQIKKQFIAQKERACVRGGCSSQCLEPVLFFHILSLSLSLSLACVCLCARVCPTSRGLLGLGR